MVKSISRIVFGFVFLSLTLSLGLNSGYAQTTPTPDALGKALVSAVSTKNRAGVLALIHPQVVSYLSVTKPALLNDVTADLMGLQIPTDYKMGVISLSDLNKSGSEMAHYDSATQTLTMMGSPAYYKIPPTHLMMLAVEKEKTVEVDGKKETKMVRVPLTPAPLPIGQYEGNWYIVIAVGKK